MGFDILSLQRGKGAQDAQKSKAEERNQRAALKYISARDLVPSENNFYSMADIEELAGTIELAGKVLQPGVAVPLGGGKYKVLSGHRRRLACLFLMENGKQEYEFLPMMVDVADADEELQAINEEITLIVANSQRDKTGWDRVQEAERLRAILEQKKKLEKVPGNMREIIARNLNTSPSQIGKLESISKYLLPEFKEALQTERVNLSVAYELSTLPEAAQKEAFAELGEKGELQIKDVKRRQEPHAAQPQEQTASGAAAAPAAPSSLSSAIDEEEHTQAPQLPQEEPEPPQGETDSRPTETPAMEPPAAPEHRPSMFDDNKCKIAGGKCTHGAEMQKHFLRGGNLTNCAGCCNNCIDRETCEHVCDAYKAVHFETVYQMIRSFSLPELAAFICGRCDGACGFCGFAIECHNTDEAGREQICERWLNVQAQRG